MECFTLLHFFYFFFLFIFFFSKHPSFKIAMSGRAGVWHWCRRPRFTFWITFLRNPSIMALDVLFLCSLMANNADSDQTPRSAASDLSLYCLRDTTLWKADING